MRSIKVLLSLLLTLALSWAVDAQSIPYQEDTYLNDFAQMFSNREQRELRADIKSMCDYYSTQIVVCTVESLDGYTIDEYADALGEQWGVTSYNANGMLIIIKPKSKNEKGEVIITTSNDLRDVFTQSMCNSMVQEQMIPHFKNTDYSGGVKALLTFLDQMSNDNTTTQIATTTGIKASEIIKSIRENSYVSRNENNYGLLWVVGIVAILVLCIIVISKIKTNRKAMRVKTLTENRDIDDILESMKDFKPSSAEYGELKKAAKQCGATQQQLKRAEILSKYFNNDDKSEAYVLVQISNSKKDEDFVFWTDLARSVNIDETYIRLAELSRQKKNNSVNNDREVVAILKANNNDGNILSIISSLGLCSDGIGDVIDNQKKEERERQKEENILLAEQEKESNSILNKLGTAAVVAGGAVAVKSLLKKRKEEKTEHPRLGRVIKPRENKGNSSKGEW